MNILLVSLYFPPLNTIAAQRAFAFYNTFRNEGHRVFVLTRFYDELQIKGNNMLLGAESPKPYNENYTSQFADVFYTNFSEKSLQKNVFNLLPPGIKGAYNILSGDVYHSGWIPFVNQFTVNKLNDFKIDLIIGTYGPPVILKVTHSLSKELNAPYVIDFRDAYIDERDSGFLLRLKQKAQSRFLKNAKGLIFVSEGMKDYFFLKCKNDLNKIPSEFICNGFVKSEEEISSDDRVVIEEFKKIKSEHDVVLLHTGTVYKDQDIDAFINWSHELTNEVKLALVFIGLSEDWTLKEQKHIYKLKRVSQVASCKLQEIADALMLPVWKNRYTGFSGKLLEYLYSGTPVICGPEPQKDLFPFFEKSGNVYIADGESKFREVIHGIKNAVITNKQPKDREFFTRNYWMKKCSKFVEGLIK